MPLSVEEAQLLMKIKGILLDFGDSFYAKEQCANIIRYIEERLNPQN